MFVLPSGQSLLHVHRIEDNFSFISQQLRAFSLLTQTSEVVVESRDQQTS